MNTLIIGRNPPRKLANIAADASKNITVTGTVDDVLPYLHQVDILVLPLRSGAGTKLRVLEGMATGICVIGTEQALMGIDGLVRDKHAFQCETVEEFVETICTLSHSADRRRAIGSNARNLVIRHYQWTSITHELATQLSHYLKNIDK